MKQKKKGNYNIIQIDPAYEPKQLERKEVFGVTFEQGRNELHIDEHLLSQYRDEEQGSARERED